MTKTNHKKLESKGWKFGDVQEFLELSDEEIAFIEMKLALGRSLKERRQRKRLSQAALARLVNSSQ